MIQSLVVLFLLCAWMWASLKQKVQLPPSLGQKYHFLFVLPGPGLDGLFRRCELLTFLSQTNMVPEQEINL